MTTPTNQSNSGYVASNAPASIANLRTPLTVKHGRIHFLGYGVSSGLDDRKGHPSWLDRHDLPKIFSSKALAAALNMPLRDLAWLSFHSDRTKILHYRSFEIPKRSGGVRTISEPRPKLKEAQYWIKTEILDKVPVSDQTHGFTRERSIVTNAQMHVNKDVLINIDLKDFFPGIHFYRVRHTFAQLGYSPAVATILGLLCTECPRKESPDEKGVWVGGGVKTRGLPQGAPTSPGLANLVARNLDKRLQGLCQARDFVYTRYADDMSFSTNSDRPIGIFLSVVKKIIEEEGFKINESKFGIYRNGHRQIVTGLVVNEDVPKVPKDYRKLVRTILHRAAQAGTFEAATIDGAPCYAAQVLGMINFIAMADQPLGDTFRRQFMAILGVPDSPPNFPDMSVDTGPVN